jgi:hypothetical protein
MIIAIMCYLYNAEGAQLHGNATYLQYAAIV